MGSLDQRLRDCCCQDIGHHNRNYCKYCAAKTIFPVSHPREQTLPVQMGPIKMEPHPTCKITQKPSLDLERHYEH